MIQLHDVFVNYILHVNIPTKPKDDTMQHRYIL